MTSRCACNLRGTWYRHALCFSSLSFFGPALLLLQRPRTQVLGGLASFLGGTSLVYHTTHCPTVRVVDVLMIFVTGGTGGLQAVHSLYLDGPNAWLSAGLVVLVCITLMDVLDTVQVVHGVRVIPIIWHLILHAMTSVALALVGVGLPE